MFLNSRKYDREWSLRYGYGSWFFTRPGSRGQKRTGDPDPHLSDWDLHTENGRDLDWMSYRYHLSKMQLLFQPCFYLYACANDVPWGRIRHFQTRWSDRRWWNSHIWPGSKHCLLHLIGSPKKNALLVLTIYAPMIYTAPCVMFLMHLILPASKTLRAGPYKSLVHRSCHLVILAREHENYIAGSVADPWHFGVDPDLDPRIHASN